LALACVSGVFCAQTSELMASNGMASKPWQSARRQIAEDVMMKISLIK
jgi:hypothetical protein